MENPPLLALPDKGSHDDELLEELLDRLKIADWDIILIGDGSGCNWNISAGWGCVMIDQATRSRRVRWGAVNRGTVNLAEMMAYFFTLSEIVAEEEAIRAATNVRRFRRVHIITDSKYCSGQGGSNNLMPKHHGAFWQAFNDFRAHGLILTWHWVPRTDLALNIYVDALSKHARSLITQNVPATETGGDKADLRSVYDLNPNC